MRAPQIFYLQNIFHPRNKNQRYRKPNHAFIMANHIQGGQKGATYA